MNNETKEVLAVSLSAETTEILSFLPYLLQDFWELGSDPEVMVRLIKAHAQISPETRVLDLACGKGAVAVKAAEKLRIKVKGIDILPEFISYANQKAIEYNVADLCEFAVSDINESVCSEEGYDIVIYGAAGIVLGKPAEMLRKLKRVIKPGGYILIDEGFLPDNIKQNDVKSSSYELLSESQWSALFEEEGLELIETDSDKDTDIPASGDSDTGMEFITARANELILKHPEKRELFEGYVQNQQNEYDDIDNTIKCVTWMLRKPL